jgi:NAD-specific glutamate dehydrogenase
MREEAYLLQRRLADQVLARKRGGDVARRVAAWLEASGAAYENVSRSVREMRAKGSADFPTLSVALQAVRQLAEG